MTTHELAKVLLDLPDVPVYAHAYDGASAFELEPLNVELWQDKVLPRSEPAEKGDFVYLMP
jgi:hypothetical protein